MKKTIITFLLFATANFTFAQQKYYAFSINGKQGITDTNLECVYGLTVQPLVVLSPTQIENIIYLVKKTS